jgi:type II secretory ATPase GspE/PulE/Tfp pilus assembly ATPase PilB-like protein
MGIEPYLAASALTAVLSQRLVRKKCTPCAECSFMGYKGRIAIFELLEINDEIRDLILKRAGPFEIEKSSGIFTMLKDGFKKAGEGITTKEEVLRVIECD